MTALKVIAAKKNGGIAAMKMPRPETTEVNNRENKSAAISILLGRTLHPKGHARIASMVVAPKYMREQ